LLLALTSLPVAQSGSIRYIYDELGRLVGVIDQNGDAAAYHYDAVGNLLSIARMGPSAVSIIEFTPNDGPIGGSVTIHGTGFSTTPSQNTVTFNGIAATVASATANTLVVTIPAGATSGQLSITTPNGTTSAAFVISTVAMPTITGLSVTIADPGSAVTISGTAFETVPGNNNVSFNVSYAALASATATQIGTAVPPGATSGRITVATPRGTAVSTQDLFVPPAPNVAADVLVADRIAFSLDKVVALGTAGKIGLLLFDLTAGQRASLKVSNGTTALSTVSIRDPYGRTAGSVALFGSGFIDTIKAPIPGTYTAVVDPSSTYTGNNTLTLYDVPPDVAGTITAGGSAVTVTTTVPGQNGRLTFAGVSAQRVSIKGTGITIPNWTIAILDPSGATLTSTLSSFLDTQTLPATGEYTVLIDPSVGGIGAMTVTLHDVPADVTGTIVAGGSSVPVAITTPGQNARLTFSGTAGQRVSLSAPAGPQSYVTYRKPDDTVLASGSIGGFFASFVEPITLPSTGTYSLDIDPMGTETGTLTLALHAVPADVSGSIVPGGSPVQVTLSAPGQNAELTFSGTAGQRISLSLSAAPTGSVTIRKPDQTTLTSTSMWFLPGFVEPVTLPSSGTYTIAVNPQAAATGSVTLTLFDVPADVSGAVTVGGSALSVTTTGAGQNAAITFGGTASQQVTVRLTNNTMGYTTVTLRKPDGTTLTASVSSGATFNLATQTLPTTGTYTIAINPSDVSTGSIDVQVTNP
jgi:YD repeat-containing protein